jgi:hypothetical protein
MKSEGWRILAPLRNGVSFQFVSMFLYQLSPPGKPVRLNSSVKKSRSASVNHAGRVSGTSPVPRSVSDLSKRKRQRFSGGVSPDPQYSDMSIVLRTSASSARYHAELYPVERRGGSQAVTWRCKSWREWELNRYTSLTGPSAAERASATDEDDGEQMSDHTMLQSARSFSKRKWGRLLASASVRPPRLLLAFFKKPPAARSAAASRPIKTPSRMRSLHPVDQSFEAVGKNEGAGHAHSGGRLAAQSVSKRT